MDSHATELPAQPPPRVSSDRTRWLVFGIWTLVLLWSMDIVRPADSQWVGSLQKIFKRYGFPESTPAKLYHCGSFALWTILLAGALAKGYAKSLTRTQRIATLGTLLAFAGIPELLQHLNPARTPSWFDVGINITGGLLGLALQVVLARYCEPASTPQTSSE